MGTVNLGRGGVVGTGQYVGRTKWARAYYDFATDGGTGAIELRGDAIPAGAVVLNTIVKVETALAPTTSSTQALSIEAANDVRTAAVATGTVVLSSTGVKLGVITRATAGTITTADRPVVLTVATADLTAGRLSVLVEYIELHAAV